MSESEKKKRTKKGDEKKMSQGDLGNMSNNIKNEDFIKELKNFMEFKEVEVPICLMVNEIIKESFTRKEKKEVEEEVVAFVNQFYEKMFPDMDERISPVAMMDGLIYIILALHTYIMNVLDEYKAYSDKIRESLLDGLYIGREDFYDPSIR